MTFEQFAKQNGMVKGSHDYSIAKASWEACIKAVLELDNKKQKEKRK